MESHSLNGHTIGAYEILGKIGQGGMAEVYKGFHPALRRHVAIKLLGRSLQNDPQISRRFQREAQAIAALRHPNIVQVFDFGVYEGGHYLVMEYVEGTDLRSEMDRRIREGCPFTFDEILNLLGQVAQALDYAHQRDIIHRDVKPANILLSSDGQVILSDFGLAMLRNRVSQLTTGHSFGTPEYIAPEQAMDSRTAVPQSDIYALGGILYEMVTGKVPFEAESAISLALKHVSEDPTPPRQHAPHLPEAVEAVILRALAKDPEERFSTAQEMIDALRQAVAQAPGSAQPTVPARPPLPPTADAPQPPPPTLPAAQPVPAEGEDTSTSAAWWRRWPVWVGLAILLLIGGVALSGGFGAGGFFPAAPPTPTPTSTATPTPTETATPTDAPTPTAVTATRAAPSPTSYATRTPDAAATLSSIPTSTPTPTGQPTSTATPTPRPTATPTRTPAPTETPSPTPTLAPGATRVRAPDEMVVHFVPPGPFPMGAAEDDADANSREKPRHEVLLTAFWMDETEVTNAQYRLCVEAEACTEPTNTSAYENPARAEHPVAFVTWAQADAYCRWLAEETGWDVSLPSEAQWEKAAAWDEIAGTKRPYPWGTEEPDATRLNYLGSALNRTAPVGSYPAGASPYGALDMAGNVWEWVIDWYDPDYYELEEFPVDPTGPDQGTQKVMRGGSYGYGARYVRTTHREVADPERAKGAGLGIRCVVNDERMTGP